ncbi:hypothetical protein AvCA_13930 [Azotobacter vinelandii CA]|uniref:Uncharacterized protein n=2 Tax=Azotobacter vinelandii TaxID=354 RepID=C1DQT7_AZOVD|nr:hypothetical protein Avin_13930 [Azotobacter vinelandii DJ]AGK17011.1 hypothetical protein AvCA_13930 [Azotobacter vinelandii CA]AGK19885.1 hypothetical protein AvCA6_13930 [Azotobacter vinelandii CA6]
MALHTNLQNTDGEGLGRRSRPRRAANLPRYIITINPL